MSEYS